MKKRLSYQTLLETSIINCVGVALLVFFWINSWLVHAIFSDTTYIVFLILILTLIAVILSSYKSIEIDRELNDEYLIRSKIGSYHKKIDSDLLKVFFEERLSILTFFSTTVIMLGLIGTVVGFIVGLYGLDPSMMRDIDTMVSSIGQILLGMSIAFYTTLAGAIAHLWIESNLLILNKSTAHLYHKLSGEWNV